MTCQREGRTAGGRPGGNVVDPLPAHVDDVRAARIADGNRVESRGRGSAVIDLIVDHLRDRRLQLGDDQEHAAVEIAVAEEIDDLGVVAGDR